MNDPLRITLNGNELYRPGDQVRFRCAPDLIATVVSVHIYGEGNVNYTVSWVHDGNLKEETTNRMMLEDAYQ